MSIQTITGIYFSPTGGTKKLVTAAAERLGEALGAPVRLLSLNTPAMRAAELTFGANELVVVGSPTYAGKLPNKLLPEFRRILHGQDTPALALVTFGNRAFDNSLAELCSVLTEGGFLPAAAGAFACRHAFSDKLAPGHPDETDLAAVRTLAGRFADKLDAPAPVSVPGDADAPYYVPKGVDGQPAKFLKARPQTAPDRCTHCGACAALCPMGSIDPAEPSNVTGVCIKCQACVRGCPKQAKYFDDAAFLSHVAMLERDYAQPIQENQMFV